MRGSVGDRLNQPLDGGVNGLRFDYGSVPSSVAKFLRGQADRIRRQCATSIIQIGKALLEAKRHLSHGGFLRWVECEVGIPVRTAQAYMRAANWASTKGATVAHLSPTALYLLSSAGAPEAFVTDILKRTEAGESIAPSVLREELKEFRSSNKREESVTEICAQQVFTDDLKWEPFVDEGQSRGAISELVAILVQALSAKAFARVRGILTSDVVLADPELARILEREFDCAAQICVEIV
jgi:hypothetical protein